jgi:hypothetical protein
MAHSRSQQQSNEWEIVAWQFQREILPTEPVGIWSEWFETALFQIECLVFKSPAVMALFHILRA